MITGNLVKERLLVMILVAVTVGLLFSVSYIVVTRHKYNLRISTNIETSRSTNNQEEVSNGIFPRLRYRRRASRYYGGR